jgi:hypothetical protein
MPRAASLFLSIALLTTACSAAPTESTTTASFVPLAGEGPTTTTSTSTTTTTAAPTTTTEVPDTEPPVVVITPEDGEIVASYLVDVVISTEPGATVVVDGEPVELDAAGTAVVERASDLGDNAVTIEATDEAGNATMSRVTYSFEPQDGWIVAVGDSVMLGSKVELEKRIGEGTVDAIVSRQFRDGIDMVENLVALDTPPQVIVMALGTNGPATEGLFDEMMEAAAAVPLVVFVNVRVPRSWESTTNTTLADGTERYDNAVLVDWWTPTHDRDDLFAKDGFHPKQPGRVIYAELVAEAIFPHWVPLTENED